MAIRGVSLLDMYFSKEFPFEFAIQSYGCTRFWSIRPFHRSADCTFATVE